jgi:ethanolamine utilization microcompartment shell protein EutL
MDGETVRSPGEVIVSALKLARERVTSDDPEAKERRREALADMVIRVQMHGALNQVPRPTAGELREILGDPDDGDLRRALEAWG